MEDFSSLLGIFTGLFENARDLLVWMLSRACKSGVEPSALLMAGSIATSILVLGSGFASATIAEVREGRRFVHMILGLAFPVVYPLGLFLLMPKPQYMSEAEEAAKAEAEALAKKFAPAIIVPPEEDKTDKMIPLPGQAQAVAAPQAPRAGAVHPSDDMTTKLSRKELFAAETAKMRVDLSQAGASTQTPPPFAQAEVPEPEPQEEERVIYDQRYFAAIALDGVGRPRGPFLIETEDGRFLEAVRISNALADVLAIEIASEGGKFRNIRLPYNKVKSCKLKSECLAQ